MFGEDDVNLVHELDPVMEPLVRGKEDVQRASGERAPKGAN
jgi:hypothetical protein